MSKGIVHQVRQGETTESLASENGLFWQTVWDHAQNKELRELRKLPNVLREGDEIFLPERKPGVASCATAQRHTFRHKGIPSKLQVLCLDLEGNPRAGEPFRLVGVAKKGHVELDDGGIQNEIENIVALAERSEVKKQWELLKANATKADDGIGYTSDCDMVELIDLDTGQRIGLGTGMDNGGRLAKEMKKNLSRFKKYLWVKGQKIPAGEDIETVRHLIEILQHGSATEVRVPSETGEIKLKYSKLGDVFVITPDGEGQVLNVKTDRQLIVLDRDTIKSQDLEKEVTRRQDEDLILRIDELAKRYGGYAHIPDATRHELAQASATPAPPPRKKPPEIRSKTAASLPRAEGELDEKPEEVVGPPPSLRDLQASLVARGMVIVHSENDWFFERYNRALPSGLSESLHKAEVVVGVDGAFEQLIVVTRSSDGVMLPALGRLSLAHRLLKDAGLTLRRNFEVVAPVALTTHSGVLGILPGAGDLGSSLSTDTVLSAMKPRHGLQLWCFRAINTQRAYSPGSNDTLGLSLEEVWVRTKGNKLDFALTKLYRTQVANRPVILFRAAQVPVFESEEDLPAVIAPLWVQKFDLSSRNGQVRALKELGFLERLEELDNRRFADVVALFQARTSYLRVDGVVGPETCKALLAALSEIESDGIPGTRSF
jgi:hypothetical protein